MLPLSNTLEINKKDIVFDARVNEFIIDKDIRMTLTEARQHYTKSIASKTKQKKYAIVMTTVAASNIKIYVFPTVPADWQTAVDQAISNWNGVNSSIAITRVYTAAAANLTVNIYNDTATTTIAYAYYPTSSGSSGSGMMINTHYNTLSASQKQFAITHEMGHNYGLTHTNQPGTLIACTPDVDANSVMNSTVLNWNGFTTYDKIGISTLYPKRDGTAKLYRYYNSGNGDHFYTTNACDLGSGKSGYVFEGDAGFLYTTAVAGTNALHRYYDPGNGDHFYTTNWSELGGGAGGYLYEGIAGYLFPTAQAGTVALYRYYNPGNGDHFYTTNWSELGGGAGGYLYESIAGYVVVQS